ncbi:MAG: phage portal protein, partial [Pirellulales bacterium]
ELDGNDLLLDDYPEVVHPNPDNYRHWANADGMSADAANSPAVRRVLRNRARYETANNSYARGIINTLANDVIGTGPRLQLLTADEQANRQIEIEFARWSKAVQLAEKLRTMRMAQATDGEAFAILISNPKLPTTVQLDLRLVEADQVTTPEAFSMSRNAVDGIVFDRFGNPVEYHVLKEHPGGGRMSLRLAYDRVVSDAMIHLFHAARPGQHRGIPDITPALPLFAQLRRFTLAVLAAAETAADFAGILYTDAPANGEADAAEPFEPIELEKRALLTMPGGWRMAQMAGWSHQWFFDGNEHVDPAKESTALATRLSSFSTTLATEYAKQGRDWETELRQ